MIYVIENKILFDSLLGNLTRIDDASNAIVLSASSGKVLLKLIENNGQLVNRALFFTSEDECGAGISSNSNLNHCVSLLRKYFRSLGIDTHLIKTIPKEGFILNANVVAQHNSVTDVATPQSEAVTPPTPVSLGRKKPVIWLGMWLLLILGLASFAGYWWWAPGGADEDNNLVFVANSGGCQIYTTENFPEYQKDPLTKRAMLNIKKHGFPCSSGRIFIFYNQNMFFGCAKTPSREFLARCNRLPDGSLSGCTSHNAVMG